MSASEKASTISSTDRQQLAEAVYKKVYWRLVPFLFCVYAISWLDRVNIAFAQLQFKQDLGFTTETYGFGVGIFYFGYILFEVPSNLLLQKIGARRTLSRIMFLFGIFSMMTMFVRNEWQFYAVRFLLGVAEAGLVPGIMLYFTYWFPPTHRARATSLLLTAVPVCGVFGSAVSGWIMNSTHGMLGLQNWQWLFFIESTPAIVAGVLAMTLVGDSPETVPWLTENERAIILEDLEKAGPAPKKKHMDWQSLLIALKDYRVYALIVVYFGHLWGASLLNFFLPQIVRQCGLTNMLEIGLVTSIPYAVGLVMMVMVGRHSDRTQERRWHVAICMFLVAIGGYTLPIFRDNWVVTTLLLTIMAAGHYPTLGIFWTVPQDYLSKETTAAGLATISCLGQLGGLLAPSVLGVLHTKTGDFTTGHYVVATLVVVGALLVVAAIQPARDSKLQTAKAVAR